MQKIFEQIGSPEKKAKLNASNALNSDIISAVNSSFKEAVKQTAPIAQNFKGSTPLETCENIWNFLRNEIKYKKDPPGYQFIRQPRAFLAAKEGDCKSFSLFGAGVLKNIYPNADVFLRYACYSHFKIPTHVYTVISINGYKIILDGVYKYFSKEKEYKYKQDYKMKVYTLSGLEEQTINGKGRVKAFFQKAKTEIKQNVQAVKSSITPQQKAKKDAPKKLKDKLKGVVKKTVKGGKTIAFAPSRAAFLGLVAANVRGLGSKVNAAIKEDPQAVKNIWDKVAGQFEQLTKTAAAGAARKRILGTEEEIGSVTGAATAIGTAAPIIVFFMDLFKKLKSPGVNDADTATLEEFSTEALKADGITTSDLREAANAEDTGNNSGGIPKPVIYGGLGLLGLMLLGGGKKLFK